MHFGICGVGVWKQSPTDTMRRLYLKENLSRGITILRISYYCMQEKVSLIRVNFILGHKLVTMELDIEKIY